MPDVAIITSDLREFANDTTLHQALDLKKLASLAHTSQACNGAQQPCLAFRQADTQSTTTIKDYLTAVDEGIRAYRVALGRVADLYVENEQRVVDTLAGAASDDVSPALPHEPGDQQHPTFDAEAAREDGEYRLLERDRRGI